MNDAIRAQTVRLVAPDGGKGLEVVLTADALELARSRGVDLVQVGLGVVRF
jgi:translation initiation factor IF-3